MKTKENKKNWILSGVILVLFVITQYMLRTKMFIYSDDVVAQERISTSLYFIFQSSPADIMNSSVPF